MKEIKGFEGLYGVTKNGKVWSYPSKRGQNGRRGKWLKTWLVGNGYKMVMLYNLKIPKKFLVHRLVALTYLPNPKKLKETNHKNGDRLDNRAKNLEWVTSKANKQHAIRLGLYGRRQKLTGEIVRKIREDYGTGNFRQLDIANKYGTSQVQVSWIVRKKGWFHID